MELSELKECLKACCVVGAGGAGFPTHLKLDERAHTIILNCSECEPLLTVHRQLLERYAKEILTALNILSETLSADVIIAVKNSYVKTVAAVSVELGTYPRMRLYLARDVYPTGDEIILISDAAGITPLPGTLPVESGFLVLNVETVYNIYNAVVNSAPVTHKWMTVTGEVCNPVTVRLPIGAPVKDAVEMAGGVTAAADSPAYIMGGPMMGYLASDDTEKIKKTTNAILVLPGDHFLVQTFKRNPAVDINRAASACCQCQSCTGMCPRRMLGYPVEPHRIMRALASRAFAGDEGISAQANGDIDAFKGVMYCSLCGLCERVACPQGLAPRSLMGIFKTAFGKAGIKPEKIPLKTADPDRELRLMDENRLAVRLGLSKYVNDAPITVRS